VKRLIESLFDNVPDSLDDSEDVTGGEFDVESDDENVCETDVESDSVDEIVCVVVGVGGTVFVAVTVNVLVGVGGGVIVAVTDSGSVTDADAETSSVDDRVTVVDNVTLLSLKVSVLDSSAEALGLGIVSVGVGGTVTVAVCVRVPEKLPKDSVWFNESDTLDVSAGNVNVSVVICVRDGVGGGVIVVVDEAVISSDSEPVRFVSSRETEGVGGHVIDRVFVTVLDTLCVYVKSDAEGRIDAVPLMVPNDWVPDVSVCVAVMMSVTVPVGGTDFVRVGVGTRVLVGVSDNCETVNVSVSLG